METASKCNMKAPMHINEGTYHVVVRELVEKVTNEAPLIAPLPAASSGDTSACGFQLRCEGH